MNAKYYSNTVKLTLGAVYVAMAVVGSFVAIPVFGSKCCPMQHLVNVLCAVTLGPWWGLLVAFTASFIRNLLSIGTLLAFPGSMCGVLLAGILYKLIKRPIFAYIGEIVGTGIIGGMLAYPIGRYIMGIPKIGVFTFVGPFLLSTCGGTLIAIIITTALIKREALPQVDSL